MLGGSRIFEEFSGLMEAVGDTDNGVETKIVNRVFVKLVLKVIVPI